MVKTKVGAFEEKGVDLFEEFGKGESGEERAEGITLGKTVSLDDV